MNIVFIKIKDKIKANIKEYVKIFVEIGEEGGIVRYRLYNINTDDITNPGTNIFIEVCDKHYIMLLINKILYNYPSINITDYHGIPLIISKYNLGKYNMWFDNIHPERKRYWKECYFKYQSLYF
jgi:hypothetical protein